MDVRKIWTEDDAFATTLMALLLDAFGIQAVYWQPETIEMEVYRVFGCDISYGNYGRLMTGISILTTNAFFQSAADFAPMTVRLNGHSVSPDTFVLPDADDVTWGVTEGLLLAASPESQNQGLPEFSEEITGLIGQILDQEGILNPPDVLRIATRDNDLVNRVQYAFSDDPEMFSAIHDVESSKTGAIQKYVRDRMRSMLQQLAELPLRKEVQESFRRVIQQTLRQFQPQ